MTAVLGTVVTICAFLLVCGWQYRVAEIDFQSRAKSYLEIINADLGDANTLLYTIAAFIGSDDHPVTAQEFAHFSASLHRRVSGLRDTGWAPHVTLAERSQFERDARAAGIARFQIRQIGPHLKLIAAPPRPEYYALRYIEAGSVKRPMFGVDLIAEKRRARAALRALQTGRPAATPPIDVVTVAQPGAGVLSYMPVYRSRSGRAGARAQTAAGLVFGAFDIPVFVETVVAKNAALRGLNLYLFNPAASSDRRVLYRTPWAPGAGAPPPESALLAGAHWQSSVSLIDQQLGAIVTPAVPLRRVQWSVLGVLTLAVGFTMTAMIVGYLIVSLRRTLQLVSLTTSLQSTTETLRENAEQITRLSLHDALTGMPNRLLFHERMDQAIARFRRGAPFGLLFLDLDRFKAVNDTLGHGAGDRLLCAVAERIANCIRETDTAARLGGDEFAIVLADTAGEVNLEQVAQRLIDSIKEPYAIDGRQIVIGVSIGGSLAGQGVTTETIVAEADLAMYDAKEAGRGVFRLFERDLRTRVDEKRVLENELRHALAAGELEVHYQPLLNLQDNRVVSFEALVRWRHPVQGMIPPARFLPVAEECGIIGQLGLWVLRTACQDAAGWPVPVKLAVNVSPLQLKDPTLFASVVKILEATGLAPRRLELELTEASVLDNSEQTLTALRQLREIGASIAFDDFGTGYSSLSSLLRFPFDKIKIDRSFIDDSERSPSAAAIVRAVVGIGTSLNLVTTGEGIETREQLARLRGYGCTEVQGFLFSPARPNSEVPRLLRELEGSAIDALQLATRG